MQQSGKSREFSFWILLCGLTGATQPLCVLAIQPWKTEWSCLTSYRFVRHHHCLQSMWSSLREKQKIITPLKNHCILVLSPYLPCSKEPRESTGQGPQMLSFSSVCSASREGSCQGANDHVLVFIKARGSEIKCTVRASAGRAYLLKREVRKWELLKEKQQNEEQK